MAYINPYERERQARQRTSGEKSLAEIYGVGGQGETLAPAEKEKEASVVRRVYDTVQDVRDNVGLGALSSVEGIVDFLIGGVGAVGGVFSPKFRDTLKKAIAYNVTEDFWVKNRDKLHRTLMGGYDFGENSYLKEDGTVNNIARGIGGMLPAVAVSIATMGAGTPAAAAGTAASAGGSAASAASAAAKAAKLAQTLSTVTMATGAAGQASQEAYQDGADFYGGQVYGWTRGATEAATEYALGGTTKLITGGGRHAMLPAVRKSVASTGIKRVAKAALEEGLEEGISEMTDPLARTTYKGKEALAEYADPAFYRRVLQAAKDGTLTGLAFQGIVGHAMGNTGKAADMQEIRSELDTLTQKRHNLHKNNRLTDEADAAIGEAERENWRVMEGVLKKADPEKRSALLEEYGLSDQFGEDGSMTAEFSAELDRRATVKESGFDRRTASVEANAEKVQKVLAKEGRSQFTDVDGLSKEGLKNLRDVKRVMDVFYDVSGGAVGNFVVAKESVADNAYYDGETGYIVIGADALEKGHSVAGTAEQSWFETTIHEALHGVEGTETFVKLVQQMGKVTFRPALLEKLNSRGYIGEFGDTWQQINDRIRELTEKDPATMTAEELEELADFKSEYAALMAEEVLGTRHFARRLLSADAGLFERILGGVQDVIAKLAKIKDPEAAEVAAEFEKAEELFLEALAEKGMRFEKGKIIGANEEDEDEVKKPKGIDKKGTVQYNKTHKSVYKQISKREYAVLSSEVTRKRAEYQSRGETVPRYDCGYTDGYFYLYENLLDYHFGVVKQIVIKPETVDFIRKVERWVEQNARTDENARTVDRIIASIWREKRHNSGSTTDGEYGRSDNGHDRVFGSEQASNGGRDNRGSGSDQRDGGVKKSRKANPQTSGKTPTWEKAPPTKKYLGVDATERVAIVDDRAYGTTNITKAVDNVIAALQAEIDESVEVSENKELVVRLSEWKKSSSVNELINKLKEAKIQQEQDAALNAVIDAVMADAYVKTIISDESLTRAVETVNRLKQYRRKIDLSQTGVSKPIYQKWGKKGGISLSEIIEDLPTAVRLTNPEDAVAVMQDVDKAYEAARQYIQINKSHKIQYFMGEADETLLRERMKEVFKDDLNAKTSAEAVERLEKQYHKQLARASDMYNFTHRMNTIFKLSENMRDIKAGRFLNQSQPENQNILNRTLGQLCRVMNGGILNGSCRKYFRQVYDWYVHDAKKYLRFDPKTNQGEYNPEIADKLQKIGFSESESFTSEELGDIINFFQYFRHMAENYRKVWRNGKLVDAIPEAEKYVSIEQENQELRQGKMNFIMSSWYMRCYADPHTLVRHMDCYREGFYSTMFERLRAGTIQTQVILKKMNDKINEALEDPEQKKKREERNGKRKHGRESAPRNTKYFESLRERTIHLHGADMPVGEAISLYMTCNREQAKAGLLENGYSFTGEGDGKDEHIRRVFGFTGGERVRDEKGRLKPEYAQYIQGMQDEIYGQLSETDKRFIKVIEDILNNDCKELKRVTDLALNGWSNAAEEYYFPIRRYETFKSIDKEGFFGEVDRVTNASFNKSTEPGAKNQLLIESVDVVLNRHMKGVAKYAALGQVIRDYDTLRTLDISGNPNAAVSIAAIEHEAGGWTDGTEYFAQLLKDVQGIREDKPDEVTKLVGKLRGHYARSVLALNPKVIATQLSSLFAGMNIIDADVMKYALFDSGRDVFEYSELAELRASENTAAMAQGLLDEAGDKLMAPIGWTDAWVVRRLWVASQYQIAKNGPKLGTVENKKAAAKLLDRVILETQQNSLATEKSQAARSHSEIQKMLTMFTSDAVKGVGQLLDAFGEITVIRNEAKVSGKPVDAKRMAAARRRAGRAAGALAAVAVYGALLAAFIKKLLDRDEEWTWKDFLSEVGAGLLGGLPVVKEFYDAFFGGGYGMEDMSVAAINDLLTCTKDTFDGLGAFVKGDLSGREALRVTRNLVYSLGQVTGMPARNVYTWSRRLVGIVAPDATYKLDNAFTKQSFKADIAKAIEQEDEGRLETVIGVMLDENVGEVTSSAVRQEMKRLVSNGMDVLPRGVGDTVTVDGEAVKLTARQQQAFKAVYSEANKSVEKMVGLAYYANASDEAKAKAIKRIYGIYYNRAIEDLLGVELENKNTLLSRAIDPEVLSVVLAVCGEITADVDKEGKVIAGSKRRKIEDFVESLKLRAAQKYMIMGVLGYKNKKGKEKVLAYVNGLGLSKSEREAIMGYAGY